MTLGKRFEGCIIGGAIGDMLGSIHENQPAPPASAFYLFPQNSDRPGTSLCITDDTQLTLATCEAIAEHGKVGAEHIAQKFLEHFNQGRLTGIGASTLKALRDMQAGMHWQYAGRQGEQAAGNGAAMRIAPLAFAMKELDKEAVEQVARITHRNDEAYAGALAVTAAIHFIINEKWNGEQDLLSMIAPVLPDTLVKDRVQELAATTTTITEAGRRYGASGYVVESVPLALLAASRINETGFNEMMQQLIAVGGDTDTNCSIAGQVAGAATGAQGIAGPLLHHLSTLEEYDRIKKTINAFIERIIGE